MNEPLRKMIVSLFALTELVMIILATAGCNQTKLTHNEINQRVIIETSLGAITVEVDQKNAPITAMNFLRYVDEERYKSASFYRVVRIDNQPQNDVKIEVIQGGIGFVESDLRLDPIAHETTEATGILHKNGTLSMARARPGTASSEFFICIGDQPELDFSGRRNPDGQGFAAFGYVVDGMDVVKAIQAQTDNDQMLVEPVEIMGIRKSNKSH